MRYSRMTSFLVLGLLLGVSRTTASGEDGALAVGADAPAIRAAAWLNVPSKTLSADDLKGRVVLVEFFETGCVPCKRTLPHVQQLHQRYAARGLTVIAVSWETAAVLAPFASEWGLTMPIACDTARVMIGGYRIAKYPTSILIDKEGHVAHVGKPVSIDGPIEAALGLQTEPAEVLSTYADAAAKKDPVGVRTAIERLIERANAEFDLKAWAGSRPAPEGGGDAPADATPVPADPAKALTELLASATPVARREAVRLALADSGPTSFDLLAFARASLGREFPLALKEAKDAIAAGRLDELADAFLDRQPPPAVLDEAVKAKKALAPRATKKAAEARTDARKALILAELVFPKEMTVGQAEAAPFWEELAATGWTLGPAGLLASCDVGGLLLRSTTASAYADRRLAQAIVFEALAAGKKPALAAASADAAKARVAILADLRSKYAR